MKPLIIGNSYMVYTASGSDIMVLKSITKDTATFYCSHSFGYKKGSSTITVPFSSIKLS